MGIGKKIKAFREQQGLSMNALAKRSGAAQSAISEIESGKRQPTYDVLERIVTGLGLSMSDFFSEEEQELPPEIKRIISRTKSLTPSQLTALDNFLATLGTNGHEITSKEKKLSKTKLDSLLPRDEINLAEALVKISEIAFQNKLTEIDIQYLHKKAVEHYGKPVFTGDEGKAAQGPKLPGQIKLKSRRDKK